MPSLLDDLFRLDNRQLAALIVVLVVVPGAVQQLEALHGRDTSTTAGTTATPVTVRSSRGRHVRPPRAC